MIPRADLRAIVRDFRRGLNTTPVNILNTDYLYYAQSEVITNNFPRGILKDWPAELRENNLKPYGKIIKFTAEINVNGNISTHISFSGGVDVIFYVPEYYVKMAFREFTMGNLDHIIPILKSEISIPPAMFHVRYEPTPDRSNLELLVDADLLPTVRPDAVPLPIISDSPRNRALDAIEDMITDVRTNLLQIPDDRRDRRVVDMLDRQFPNPTHQFFMTTPPNPAFPSPRSSSDIPFPFTPIDPYCDEKKMHNAKEIIKELGGPGILQMMGLLTEMYDRCAECMVYSVIFYEKKILYITAIVNNEDFEIVKGHFMDHMNKAHPDICARKMKLKDAVKYT